MPFGGKARNSPLPFRRRQPLTLVETAFLLRRYGRRSWQTFGIMAGTSGEDIRRAFLKVERGAPSAQSEAPNARYQRVRHTAPVLRTATRSFADAASELGLTTEALHAWLVAERWIRRDSTGATIAAATRLTAGHLNQPVRQEHVGQRGVRLHYGTIRFTPRGMANLRAHLGASAGAAQ